MSTLRNDEKSSGLSVACLALCLCLCCDNGRQNNNELNKAEDKK